MSTGGRYRHVVKLGEGTYGSVYRGTERDTGRVVAFKRMVVSSDDEGVPATAIREICLLKELKHENIVDLFEVLFDPPKITLIFELCDYDLKRYIEHKENEKLDPEHEVRPMLKQMFAGLAYLHGKSIVHRDMKPQNVFLNIRPASYEFADGSGQFAAWHYLLEDQQKVKESTQSSSSPLVFEESVTTHKPSPWDDMAIIIKLGDFGLARVEEIPVKKYSHEAVTLWYRSPDVLMGSALYSFPVDIWSMGAIFFEMVTGKVLFAGRNEEDQLVRMFQLLGAPTQSTWKSLLSYPNTTDRLQRAQSLINEGKLPSALNSTFHTNTSEETIQSNDISCNISGTTRHRHGLSVVSAKQAERQGGVFTSISSSSPTAASARPSNDYWLPQELWYPLGTFDEVMTSSGFRAAVGESGVELLRECLRYEPHDRITAAQALEHPFMKHVRTPCTNSISQLMTSLEQTLLAAGL